jgi:eukaryotic-like serine/threonine-protein kinase
MIHERIFNNRYRLDRKLGEGGMAEVYCGTDVVLRRRVAIKVLREQYAADEEFVRRFYQEAESAARLSHPNIVNTYDVGHEDRTYFIVMELVDGPSLGEIISVDGKLPEPVAIHYATQIASGLAYAHRVGLLHRDIKPANVLVTKDDVVKLSDFGIARAVSQQTMTLTKPGLVMGSVYYMPPEQALGGELHEASDLYSLGIVLYQMLMGKLPYTGESPVSVALKHVHDPVPSIDGTASGVSPALAAIVNKLLQKKPEHRFLSASELATALREARERPSVAGYRISDDAETMAVAATRSLPPRRSPLPDRPYTSLREDEEDRSRRGPWVIFALVALMLLATGVGYVLFGRPMPDFGASITVGDYTDMTDAQAQSQIVGLGLRVRFDHSPSDTVPINHVIRQNPTAGVRVDRNTLVTLVVSNGKPLVGLDDYRTFTAIDAQRTLVSQGFVVSVMHKFDSAPKETVIDTLPKPGSKVAPNSHITLIVSNGLPSIQVPTFVGLSVQEGQAAAAKAGITLDTSQQAAVAGVPANTIAQQDVPGGTTVQRGAVVHATVSTGIQNVPAVAPNGPTVAVPDVTNESYKQAIDALTNAGFKVAVSYVTQTASQGNIVQQSPRASAPLSSGGTVYVTLAVSGEVPDTNNMTIADATETLAAYGYVVGKTTYTTTAGQGGRVVGTDPEVGTGLAPGSSVTLVVNGTPPQ